MKNASALFLLLSLGCLAVGFFAGETLAYLPMVAFFVAGVLLAPAGSLRSLRSAANRGGRAAAFLGMAWIVGELLDHDHSAR